MLGYFFFSALGIIFPAFDASDKKLGEFLLQIYFSLLPALSLTICLLCIALEISSLKILIISMDWRCSELNKSILLQFVFTVPLIFINFQEMFINVFRIELNQLIVEKELDIRKRIWNLKSKPSIWPLNYHYLCKLVPKLLKHTKRSQDIPHLSL